MGSAIITNVNQIRGDLPLKYIDDTNTLSLSGNLEANNIFDSNLTSGKIVVASTSGQLIDGPSTTDVSNAITNSLSSVQKSDLTDGGSTTLHTHDIVGWTDYYTPEGIVGWQTQGLTSKILYKVVGTLCFCKFYLNGISNTSNAGFELPFTISDLNTQPRLGVSKNFSGGTWYLGDISSSGADPDNYTYYIRKIYSDTGNSTWANPDENKIAMGEFWFEIKS